MIMLLKGFSNLFSHLVIIDLGDFKSYGIELELVDGIT